MKYFIICSCRFADAYRQLNIAMAAADHELIHDWLAAKDIDLEIELRKDIHFIKQADMIIAIAPGGYDTQIELGIAIGARKPIMFICPTSYTKIDSAYMESSFMLHCKLTIVDNKWAEVATAAENAFNNFKFSEEVVDNTPDNEYYAEMAALDKSIATTHSLSVVDKIEPPKCCNQSMTYEHTCAEGCCDTYRCGICQKSVTVEYDG